MPDDTDIPVLRPRTVGPSVSSPTEDARLVAALWSTSEWEATNVAVAVVGPDGTIATIGSGRPFRLASVTKLLLAYACLVAVEEGTLDLDAEAGQPGATVRHLLAHTAGFGFDTGILTQPGRKRIYSNTGFLVLSDVLAKEAGMVAEDYVRAAVLDPLGMHETTFGDGGLAHGGSAPITDMAAFALELLVPTLVHRSTLAEATTVTFPGLDGALPGIGSQRPNDWGLGFELRSHKSPHWTGSTNSPQTFGHYGGAGTFLWVDPVIDRSLVVLTDLLFGQWALEAWPKLSDAVVTARSSAP